MPKGGQPSSKSARRPSPDADTLKQQRLDRRAVLLMLALCAAWGVQQVAGKVALEQGMPPISQALLRSLIGGALLLAWLFWRGGRTALSALFARDGTLWPGLLIAGLFALEFVLLYEGVLRNSAARSVVLLYTAAFFTALGTHWLVPDERLRPLNVLGFLLAFGGVVVTLGGKQGGSSLLGDLLVLGAAIAWGLTTVAVKASAALGRVSAEKVAAYQVLGSIPILLAVAMLKGEPLLPTATPLAWASVLYQSVGVTFVSYLTWFWLIARYPAGRLAAFSFLTPLFGVVAAAALLGEAITASLLLGLAGVGAGLVLVNR
jgi:drug/metabolite transporter (DMT)-like permease